MSLVRKTDRIIALLAGSNGGEINLVLVNIPFELVVVPYKINVKQMGDVLYTRSLDCQTRKKDAGCLGCSCLHIQVTVL